MKLSEYILITVLLLCMACSPDQETYEAMGSLSDRMLPTPENSDNPYDDVGRIYRASLPGTHTGYPLGTGSKRRGNATDPRSSLHTLSIGWSLSTPAQARFRELVDTILSASHDGYAPFHAKMVTYEAHTMDDPILTDLDKQYLLTFASLVRHASYPETNVQGTTGIEDEDWDISIPNAMEVAPSALDPVAGQDTDPIFPSPDKGPSNPGP
ncbi:hypothetical protein [Flagellimonas hadalis]|uniref:Uncharacterized protein n=1 Tax=Flagellimonas hadalis TaxID=2597517 RepID=A0A5N5IK45_9FLAO|nr:hypothetical protein [Allomuricauda hadalis]KAB5484214.1 hypothetical protein FOT42_016835 [Allomuricauda hadalis]